MDVREEQQPSQARRSKRDFISWFDSLEYEPEDTVVPVAENITKLLKKKNKKKKKKVCAKYLDIPKKPPQEAEKKKNSTVLFPKLPRVATLVVAKKEPTETEKNEEEQVVETQYQPGIDFWGACDVCDLVTNAKVGFVPTLIFDFEKQLIRWVCFREHAGTFTSVKDMASMYAKIMQSLCFFESSPLVVARTIDSTEYAISKNDLVMKLERLCTQFTTAACHPEDENVPKLVILQAVPPPSFGKMVTLSSGKLLRRIERHTRSIGNIEAKVIVEQNNKWILNVERFVIHPKKVEIPSEKPKKRAPTSNSFRWCIGDFCKNNKTPEELPSKDDKHPVVYKMVLQHRMGVQDTNQLSELLPAHLRARMYETVKVCKICFDELTNIEEQRMEIEKLEKEKKRQQRVQAQYKKLAKKTAKLAAQAAKERKQRLLKEDLEKKQQAEKITKEILAEFHCQPKETEQATSSSSPEPEPVVVVDTAVVKNIKKKKPPVYVPKVVEFESVDFTNITCESFFGNDVEKLNICQGVMDTLRSGKSARLLAPISSNNMSTEECRLVLRSIYLEFRGMCLDQGYFPDVPMQGENAVMTLQPLPSYSFN